MTDRCQEMFEAWFPTYAATQYPFYKAESAAEALKTSLGQSLRDAFQAGYAARDPLPAPTLSAEDLARVREFLDSFSISVNIDSYYKDTAITLNSPHSLYVRVQNDSTKSWIFADLEERRKAALAILPAQEGV